MIREIKIKNYKSIEKLKLELGRVNVFIGENGCGKSNILEAIALGSAAVGNKLDNEFLFSRGIRVTDKFMKSAFNSKQLKPNIFISFTDENKREFIFNLKHDHKSYSKWEYDTRIKEFDEKILAKILEVNIKTIKSIDDFKNSISSGEFLNLIKQKIIRLNNKDLINFLIFSPENQILKTFEKEGQIQPLGIKGEGLFKFLQFLNNNQKDKIDKIKQHLKLIDWFQDFDIPDNFVEERNIKIKDKYLSPDLTNFTQKSSNEGFLFILFYFCLFISHETPQFFAIDNIDNSLNPRLCRRLIEELVTLAEKNDKQVVMTTHNSAVLDGLNLDDDEQRLYVIYRNHFGHTKARRVVSPKPLEDEAPVRLSEAFLRGYIGGLPKEFLIMVTFALITEGLTDQIVIENILIGYFNNNDISINPLQPERNKDDANKSGYGGWKLVFDYLKNKLNEFKAAFQVNDYIIISIDTDVSEDKNYDIYKRNEKGNELTPEELIKKVKQKFISLIGNDFYWKYSEKIIFAIAVHSTECWLLPLYYKDKRKSKIVNCLETLNQKIKTSEKFTIDKNNKNPDYYRKISKQYCQHKTLIKYYQDNPSLKVFIEGIKSRDIVIEEEEDW